MTCFQTYNAAWPKSSRYDEVVLAAILNSPITNAFVSTREGKTDNTVETLRSIPVPVFTAEQRDRLKTLVDRYQKATAATLISSGTLENPETLLKQIDAVVLDGYRMPPRLERQVLDFFNGQERPVAHAFGDYFANDNETYFSLSQMLDPRFVAANVGKLLERIDNP